MFFFFSVCVIYIYIYIHTCTHTYIYIHIYIHTYTHQPRCSLFPSYMSYYTYMCKSVCELHLTGSKLSFFLIHALLYTYKNVCACTHKSIPTSKLSFFKRALREESVASVRLSMRALLSVMVVCMCVCVCVCM